MKLGLAYILTCAGSILPAGVAVSADIYTPVTPDARQVVTERGWTFTVAPYFWAAGLSGDIAQFGLPQVHVDPSFREIFDQLDFAAMAIAEARYDRYSIFSDIIYVKVSGVSETPRGILASDVDITSKSFAGLFGAGYSLFETGSGNIDLVGGVRVWSVDTELSFSGGILDGISRSDGATWVDGLAGLRGNYSVTPTVYLTGWGLVGAGGADIDWDVAGGIGYRFNDWFSAVAGYRALGVDYSDDGFVFDVVQHGPILGLVVRF